MKKITIYHPVFAIATIALFFASCKKENNSSAINTRINVGEMLTDYFVKKGASKDGVVTMYDPKMAFGYNHYPNNIMINAVFYESRNEAYKKYAGQLKIANITIPYYTNSDGYNGYNLQAAAIEDSAVLKTLYGVWGKTISIKLKGDAASKTYLSANFPHVSAADSSVVTEFYVPASLQMSSSCVDNFRINTSTNTQISWTPDANNPTQKVIIGLIDEGSYGHEQDSSIVPKTQVIFFQEIPDNGSYTFTTGILQGLKVGSYASAFMARGNYSVYTDPETGKQILIEAISYTLTGMLGVTK